MLYEQFGSDLDKSELKQYLFDSLVKDAMASMFVLYSMFAGWLTDILRYSSLG